jgi:hypothetical protein
MKWRPSSPGCNVDLQAELPPNTKPRLGRLC